MNFRLRNTTLDNRHFLNIQMIISALIIIFTLVNKQSLTSTMFTLSFINLLILYVTSFRYGKIATSCWVLIVWCIISIMISYLGGTKQFALVDLISFATFVATIMYLQVACTIDVTKAIAHSVLFIGVVSAAFYPIGFYLFKANEFRSMGSLLLTMHFSSPNLTGMYLAQACLVMILCFLLVKRRYIRIVCVVIFAFDFYFLYLTGARNSLITVLLAFAGILYVTIKRKKKIHPWISFIVSITPLVFAIAYLLFIQAISMSGHLDFLVEEGKPITSRFRIWSNVFSTLKGVNWLFGDFEKLRGNLHNTHITILGSYGIIGILLLVKYLNNVMSKVNKTITSSSQTICLICFFGTIFMGNGEAALVYGSMGLYAFACSYLILARYDWDNDCPITKKD